MDIQVNGVLIKDVNRVSLSDCEFSLSFIQGHRYSSIKEIAEVLNQIGLSIGNFYFKGVKMWDYDDDWNPLEGVSFDEDGVTDLLCVLPYNLRNNIRIVMGGETAW